MDSSGRFLAARTTIRAGKVSYFGLRNCDPVPVSLPPDHWRDAESVWEAPELDLGDGRRLVLDSPDPFPEEEWAVSGVN